MLLQMAIFHSFLWLINIPACVCVCDIFLNQSSVHGLLGCFHVLVIITNAAMLLLGCMYLFKVEFLSFPDICPRVGLLDHMVTLFLVF